MPVSIVIPAYNASRFIRECLDSVIAQTLDDWEAVVVDDGSTDDTGAIVTAYSAREPRIRLVSKVNGGLSDARNYGVGHARGEWVTFLDSDDCLLPRALEALTGGIDGETDAINARLVNGRSFRADSPAGRIPPATTVPVDNVLEGMLYQTHGIHSACGKLFRRSILIENPFVKGIMYEDMEFCLRVYPTLRRVKEVDYPVYFYRRNPSSFIHTFSPARLDALKVMRDTERRYASLYPALLPAVRDRRMSACFNALGLLSVYDKEGNYNSVADECLAVIREYRRASLFNPKVRLKNKIGILVSYSGKTVMRAVMRMIFR